MTDTDTGRTAQRRRTRRAILDAAHHLLAGGASPSINEIAEAADVSRRTVYLHFPTLDQLLLDAAAGALSSGVDEALAAADPDDARVRLQALTDAVAATMAASLPLGRQMVRLTVSTEGTGESTGEGPRRGVRRVGWIESALAPVRPRLAAAAYERLVSMMAVVVGWEAFIVLLDVRGLDVEEAGAVTRAAALALYDAVVPSRSAPT